jgi:membrane fusion protein, multidrug efflux system
MTLKRRITVFLIAALVVAAVVGVYYMPHWQQTLAAVSKGGRRGGPAANGPVPVLATTARLADVPVYLDGVGTAKALNTVTVRSQVDGKIMEVLFTEGQDVPKGYLLAKIDPVTYQAAYDQTVAKKAQDEAQLANARLDLDRYTRLAATNAVNKQQLDTQRALVAQLEAQIKLDQAAIDNARAVLSYTDVIAPIAGRTGIRLVDAGNLVRGAEATGIVILTQLRPISVFFSLPQQNLPELNKGMAEGGLPLDALNTDGKGALDKGKVTVIDNQVDQTTGTVKLRAEFPNKDLQLWPGQFVNVRVLIDTLRQAVVVPTAAIQRGPNGAFVYVLKQDKTVTVRPVTLAQQDRFCPPHRGHAGRGIRCRGRRPDRARRAAASRRRAWQARKRERER